jgi:hypothetical protein
MPGISGSIGCAASKLLVRVIISPNRIERIENFGRRASSRPKVGNIRTRLRASVRSAGTLPADRREQLERELEKED